MASSLCSLRGSSTAELVLSGHIMEFGITVTWVYTQGPLCPQGGQTHKVGGSERISLPAAKLYSESHSPDPWTGRCLPLGELSLKGLFSEVICLYPARPSGTLGASVWGSVLDMVWSIPSRLLSARDNQRIRQTSRWWAWQQIYMLIVS